jgi:Icc-related predicted phosphoesterase
MVIKATSDLHGYEPTHEQIGECDLLLVGGDIMPVWNHEPDFQLNWLDTRWREWLRERHENGAKKIVWIAGNHDFALQKDEGDKIARSMDTEDIMYLCDEGIVVNGIKIWGFPWTPNLPGWAFQYDSIDVDDHLEKIPDDTDILLSHGPPYGAGDKPFMSYSHVGSTELKDIIANKKIPVVVCGHIHEGFGFYKVENSKVYVVSYLDRNYEPNNRVVEIDYDR